MARNGNTNRLAFRASQFGSSSGKPAARRATWIATAAPVTYVGATPIFVDVERDTWCMSVDSVRAALTSNTRQDGRDLLAHVATHPLRVVVTPYPLDRADQALADLAADRVTGAAVLIPS